MEAGLAQGQATLLIDLPDKKKPRREAGVSTRSW